MDTASLQFVAFGLVAAIASNLRPSPLWRSIVLATASLFFLVLLAKNPFVYGALFGFLLLGYLAITVLEKRWIASTVAVVALIFVYIWLKKYTFLPPRFFLRFSYSALGLSYIFFRVLHLVIESGEQRQARQPIGLGHYLLYTTNFTTFIAGPIQRFDEFARDQFADDPPKLGIRVIGTQLERIVRGYFKVNVLALVLHSVQEDALVQLSQPGPLAWRIVVACKASAIYPLFLYANFSGYIDIVMAIARLMHVRLPENFDRPFSAPSFIEFWNRWHITLSSWLKSYVYNPLLVAMMRRVTATAWEPFLVVIAFFTTFLLIGIWHGRTSEFVVYGLILAAGISINKLWQMGMTRVLGRKGYKALAANTLYRSVCRGLTFSWFAFSLFWLWASWKQLGTIFTSLSAVEWLQVWLLIWMSATAILGLWEWLRLMVLSVCNSEGPLISSRYVRVVFASALAVISIAVTLLLNQPAPDIVYKTF